MIDKPVAPAGTAPSAFSPLARAVMDSVNEGVVIFDQQGRVLYANAAARRTIDGQTAMCATGCRISALASRR